MTTPCCQNKIEIHTDPKNACYTIVEGAKLKVSIHQALYCLHIAITITIQQCVLRAIQL